MQAITDIPNLLLIGAPKSGTTSLLSWIRKHPEVYHPWGNIPIPNSESGFLLGGFAESPFSPSIPVGTLLLPNNIDMDNYKNQKWIIDKSPQHLYSDNALNYVSNYLPNSKIIITLRNPYDLFISWYGQMNKGINYNTSFEELIDMLDNSDWKANIHNQETWSFLTYPKYSELVMKWIEELGEDRVKVIKLTSIASNPRGVLDSICEWLDIDSLKLPQKLAVSNQGGKLSNTPLRKFLRHPPNFVFKLVRLFLPSRNFRRIIFDPIRRIGWKYVRTEKKNISPEVEERIKTIFIKDIEFFDNIEEYIPSTVLIN